MKSGMGTYRGPVVRKILNINFFLSDTIKLLFRQRNSNIFVSLLCKYFYVPFPVKPLCKYFAALQHNNHHLLFM